MAIGLSVLAALAAVLMPATQDAQVHFLSDRFAVRTGLEADAAQLELYDEKGDLVQTSLLGSRVPIAGPGGVAILEAPKSDGSRSVEVHDLAGELLGRFAIPGKQELIMGRESLALVPMALHEAGTEFSVRFLSFGGVELGMQVLPDLTLLGVVADAGGYFLAHSRDGGTGMVTAFQQDGQLLWTFRSENPWMPKACVSPDGTSAVTWTIASDRMSAQVHLLNGIGNELLRTTLGPVHSAAYSQDGSTLVLAGWDYVAILDVLTNKIVWQSSSPLDQPAGAACAISADGRRLDLLTRPNAGASSPRMRTIVKSSGVAEVQDSMHDLAGVPSLGHVLSVARLKSGEMRIVSAAGQWKVLP